MDEIREFIEEERGRRAVRAWYGNTAFFAALAVMIVLAALCMLGSGA